MNAKREHSGNHKPSNNTRLQRWMVLLLMGGMVFQLTGCITGLAPVLVSFAESAALNAILGGLVTP